MTWKTSCLTTPRVSLANKFECSNCKISFTTKHWILVWKCRTDVILGVKAATWNLNPSALLLDGAATQVRDILLNFCMILLVSLLKVLTSLNLLVLYISGMWLGHK